MLQKQTNSEQNTNKNQDYILEEEDFLSGIIPVCELDEECESCQ